MQKNAVLLLCLSFCLLVAFLGCLNARTEKVELPGSARMDAIHFENENHGFVRACCGKDNKIFETFDGGRSWRRTEAPVPGLRRGRAYHDQTNGWSVVEDNWPHTSVYQTTDGGKTWKRVLRAEKEGNFYFDAIQATSTSDIWALGVQSYHTTDAGRNWEQATLGYAGIDFLDPENGWALGGSVWKTRDGGRNWREIVIPSSLFPVKSAYLLTDIYFTNLKKGWIVGGMNEENLPDGKNHGIILTTSDGGETWRLLAHLEDRYLWSVFFLNERLGWVAGLNGTFLKTENGGETWIDPSTNKQVHSSK
jgi:photosystem II stability/assembly factor-like uncharacterized protein